MNKYKFFATVDYARDGFGLDLVYADGGQRALAVDIKFTTMDPINLVVESRNPLLFLSYEDAQRLMDELFRVGVRPSDEGSPGQLAAVKYHLEDMRRLVFEGKQK